MAQPYLVGLALAGVAVLGVTLLPRLLSRRLLTAPMVLVGLGLLAFSLPLGLDELDPMGAHRLAAERLTELAVIVALMGCGLRLDRPLSWRAWKSTWLLLGVAMPLTIGAVALLGAWAGLPAAAALLFGAAMAPTDPVLAGDVQVGPPGEEESGGDEEPEVRFALTAEAGLNDGLAFPFVNAAVLMAAGGAASSWVGRWLAVELAYRVLAGVAVGFAVGWFVAWLLFRSDEGEPWPTEGPAALAATLLAYAAGETVGGYGFLAVFVAALTMRRSEKRHRFHRRLHAFTDAGERLLMAAVLVALGGALAAGVLRALDWRMAAVGLALVFVVRPAVATVALLAARHVRPAERWGIGLFGIRGIGSLYYLAHALHVAEFPQAERLWAAVVFTVLCSLVVHGFAAGPLMARIERRGTA